MAGRAVPSPEGVPSNKFYGVAEGRKTGVYTSWVAAEAQIKGWKNPKYKKFATRAEAEAFVESGGKLSQPLTGNIANDSAEEEENEPPTKRLRKNDEDEGNVEGPDFVKTTVVPPNEKVLKKGEPLKIWTDGSALGNGRAGAAAGVGVFFGNGDPR